MKRIFLALIAVLFLPTLSFARDCWFLGGWGPMMHFGYGGGFMWFIFLILVGVVVYLLLRRETPGPSGGVRRETPLDILKRRYAQGKITKEEFERMRQDLS